jgi:hypothetical protein
LEKNSVVLFRIKLCLFQDGFIQDPLLPEENGSAKKTETDTPDHEVAPAKSKPAVKFGWIKGVLVSKKMYD